MGREGCPHRRPPLEMFASHVHTSRKHEQAHKRTHALLLPRAHNTYFLCAFTSPLPPHPPKTAHQPIHPSILPTHPPTAAPRHASLLLSSLSHTPIPAHRLDPAPRPTPAPPLRPPPLESHTTEARAHAPRRADSAGGLTTSLAHPTTRGTDITARRPRLARPGGPAAGRSGIESGGAAGPRARDAPPAARPPSLAGVAADVLRANEPFPCSSC